VTKWGAWGKGKVQIQEIIDGFRAPRNVAVAPDGSVYVLDHWDDRIQKFSIPIP